jgi:Peptidase family C25, C terminal ig-like domain./Peptidase family C25./Propeptide_C25.
MKKTRFLALACLFIAMCFTSEASAQGRIDLKAAKSAQSCTNITENGFNATFSFGSIEAKAVSTEKGVFSDLQMENTFPSGAVGTPSIPAARKLIAIPYGAKGVTVSVNNYTTTDYDLSDYGIKTLIPRQESVRKDQKPEDIKFAYDKAAYMSKSFDERPIAQIEILGTMRGMQIGALTINPISYNPGSNCIKVYNDIEVSVSFSEFDKAQADYMLKSTSNIYFKNIYEQMFNFRDDVYTEHPDLWNAPVHMLVVANRMFEEVMQPWVEWKTKKGFYMDVNFTDEIGTSASAIQSFIQGKYNEGLANGNVPTFVIIFGDNAQVPASATGNESGKVTDLYYGSIDGDYFPDMYYSRMSAENTTQMTNIINKILTYEKYTMADPSYLNNALLIAGEDSNWNPQVGQPTVNYGTTYYFNEEHGFDNVYAYLNSYAGCYDNLNTGVGFANYTAHGGETCWAGPGFYISDVNALTNTDKYFWAMGNCCVAANWGYSSECFGEAMIRAENKAAFGYIGSCPNSYWYEDYYFGVGATTTHGGATPSNTESSTGTYDAYFMEDVYNTLSSTVFVGNLAVCYAHDNNYGTHSTPTYYWQAYHVLGDGSVMPFTVEPSANNVSHLPTLPIGMDFYTISADPGSYAAISKDGVLYGAGLIGESGTANIAIEPITSGGDVDIVVTHPQRQPYMAVVPAASLDGAYITVNNYVIKDEDGQMDYGEGIELDVDIKNVGSEAASNLSLTLSTESEYITMIDNTASIASLAADEQVTLENAFSFEVGMNIPEGEKVMFFVTITDGNETWESKMSITAHAPSFEMISAVVEGGSGQPGQTSNLVFTYQNVGTSMAYNTVLEAVSSSNDITFTNTTYSTETVDAGEIVTVNAEFSVANDVELGSTYEVNYYLGTGHYNTSGTTTISIGNIMEDFETGDLSTFDWQLSGEANWTVVTEEPYAGTYCLKSGDISDGNSTNLTLTIEVLADGEISFFKRVSSETNYDKLHFYIDDQEVGVWSGSIEWGQESYPITAGNHTLIWSYTKDSSVSNGSDCAWLDNIQFPPTNVVMALESVTDLTAEVENYDVTLTWSGVADADEYIVRRDGEIVGTTAATTFAENLSDGIYVYSVVATNAQGMNSAPAHVTVEVGVTGIEDVEVVNFQVYPNPASNVLNINVNGNAANVEYAIYNYQGQMMMRKALGSFEGTEQIDLSNVAKGIYFLRLTAGNQVDVQKIVVE